ncbi:MAG: hypothetical protein EXS05_03465 [Planctomycetaceae bacterium]|nr:hypothetical protein [Planctomycetaceae bacterium]
MHGLEVLGTIFGAGALGGLVNALMADKIKLMPGSETAGDTHYYYPGLIGNLVVSGVAAVVSWGLYGPFASANIIGPATDTQSLSVTYAAFVGAILVGMAGARWLSNEVDKTMLRTAASLAASKGASEDVAAQLRSVSPAEAVRLTEAMP